MQRPHLPAALVVVYSMLLRLYPPAFSQRFGDEMVCDFEDAARDAWGERQWVGLWRLCAAAFWDWLCTLFAQWVKHGWHAAVGASIAATISCGAVLAQFRPPSSPNPPSEQSPEELLLLFTGAVIFLLITTTIVFTVGFWLLVMRRSKRA